MPSHAFSRPLTPSHAFSRLLTGTLPATLGDALSLEVLRFDSNLLSGSLPSTIGKLSNVQKLDMHSNRLQVRHLRVPPPSMDFDGLP